MADDVNILDATGSSVTIATDEVVDATYGTAQVQIVKVIDARDNGTNRAGVDESNRTLVANDEHRRVVEEMQILQLSHYMNDMDPRRGFEIR